MEELKIRDHNIKPHADVEIDIIQKKNGQMTFTLRINAGNIVDYNLVEYVDIKRKYGKTGQAGTVVVQEYTIPSTA